MDHPKKTRPTPLTVHCSKKEMSTQIHQQDVSTQMQEEHVQVIKPVSTLISKKQGMKKLATGKEQILTSYLGITDGISRFSGSSYQIQFDPNITTKQTPCQPVSVHLKEAFKKEVDKMLKAGIINPFMKPLSG